MTVFLKSFSTPKCFVLHVILFVYFLPIIQNKRFEGAPSGQSQFLTIESPLICGGETILRPFSKKSKLSIPVNHWSKILYSLFLFYAKCIETKLQTTCFHVKKKYFQKTKRGLELVSFPHHFSSFKGFQ